MEPTIKFVRQDSIEYGVANIIAPNIRLITAPNSGPYTYTGTGTYLIGSGRNLAIIDPGPNMPEHLSAIMQAIEGETLSHIFVTHTHKDHSPAARPLSIKTGAPVFAFGPHAGSPSSLDGEDVEEGADHEFVPDQLAVDGSQFKTGKWTITAIHTPGHTSNHMCYYLEPEKILFSGDHIMGWATSVISPPDGNMADYLRSLERLRKLDIKEIRPTHGPAVENPQSFITQIIEHRLARELQILNLIKEGVSTIDAIVEKLYQHIPKTLFPAAARSVFAHIIHLLDQNKIATNGRATLASRYRLI